MATRPAKGKPVAKRQASKSTYTKAVGSRICERLADGESLRTICQDAGMPNKATVFRWLARNDSFRDQYARAREAQADAIVDEILDIADEECTKVKADKHPRAPADDDGMVEVVFDAVAVQRNKLRIDARKWLAGKLKPKVYGDKPDVDDPDDLPPTPVKVVVQVKDARADDADA